MFAVFGDDDDEEGDSDGSDDEDNGDVSLSEVSCTKFDEEEQLLKRPIFQVYNDDLEEDNSDWEEGEGGDDDEDEDSDIDEADGDANESAASVNANAKDGDKPGESLDQSPIKFIFTESLCFTEESQARGKKRKHDG